MRPLRLTSSLLSLALLASLGCSSSDEEAGDRASLIPLKEESEGGVEHDLAKAEGAEGGTLQVFEPRDARPVAARNMIGVEHRRAVAEGFQGCEIQGAVGLANFAPDRQHQGDHMFADDAVYAAPEDRRLDPGPRAGF